MGKAVRVGVVVALCVGATAFPAEARKPRPHKRVVELAYAEAAVGAAGAGVCFPGTSCLFYGAPAAGETHFAVELEDDLGQPVPASVIQDTNGDGNSS